MTQPMDQWTGVAALVGAKPSWVPSIEQNRIASYSVYDDLYWNESQTFQLMMRGTSNPADVIYVPNPRKIVETLHRYVGANFKYAILEASGTPASRLAAKTAIDALFARERFYSKYNANKRFGMVRGDWLWEISADPFKPEGSRLSILPIHPANYFPVFESDIIDGGSPDKIVKVHLAEEIISGDDTVIRRQTYEKVVNPSNGTVTILSSLSIFELDSWYEEDSKTIQVLTPPTPLPPDITAIPVYHIRNFDEPGNPYGSSELRGFERLMAAINQGYTDEDMALALEGLGVYATDSPSRPIDAETGEVTDYFIYPGRVMHNAPGFRRVPGVGSIEPYGDHLARLANELKEAASITDAAIGKVDVQVAESGVALLLHFAPTLAKAGEKDQIILDVHTQMFYDLRAWLKVFEGVSIDDVTIVPTLGDKLPKNHKGIVDLITMLMSTSPPVLSAATAREYLVREGLDIFALDEALRVKAEQDALAAQADPFGTRAGGELGEGGIGSEADSGGSEGGEG